MQEALDMARRSAISKAHVLISGEPGVGKKTLAGHVGQLNGDTCPCVLVSASLLDEDSIDRAIHAAQGGSLILEDIQLLSAAAQVVLLCAIRGNKWGISQTGSAKQGRIQIVATTCQDLFSCVARGAFRQDLYWLISPLSIRVPPLRERTEDLRDLVQEMLEQSCHQHGRKTVRVSDAALDEIKQYSWPGNLSQLRCFLDRSVIVSDSSELSPESVRGFVEWQSKMLQATGCPLAVSDRAADERPADHVGQTVLTEMGLSEIADQLIQKGISQADLAREPLHSFIVNHVEKQLIAHVLAECEQVQLKAAARLGINRNTLHKKLKEYHLGGNE